MVAVAGLCVLAGQGALSSFDRVLHETRFSVAGRAPTGNVVVVAIDSPSLAEIGIWPWPRQLHAQALDTLLDLGANEVAFDIDFSSSSNPASDAAFAGALERAGGFAWLGAFEQVARGQRFVSRPLAAFAAHADAAAVNVMLDKAGMASRFLSRMTTPTDTIPAMAAVLSGRTDLAEATPGIDFGIDARGIDQISFVDLLKGRISSDRIDGKSVIIGATAVELRDIFAVPRYDIMAGPVLQALSTETLLQHRELRLAGWIPAGLIAAIVALGFGMTHDQRRMAMRLATAAAVAMAAEIAALAAYAGAGWLLDTALLHASLVALIAIELGRIAQLEQLRRDIAQRRLAYLATHDQTTDTLSRSGLIEAVGRPAQPCTVVVIAILRLNQVRATLGGDVADSALAAIAGQLRRVANTHLAYIAEDLFCLHFEADRLDVEIEETCRDIELAIGGVLQAAGNPVLIAADFGFARGGFREGALLRDAEAALMQGQRAGLQIAGFTAEQGEALRHRRRLSVDFHHAIERDELRLVYQPQFDLRSGKLVGVEALMRWHHGALGAVSPGEFIPLAEESGDMIRLGQWALLRACRDAMHWDWQGRVAVNVSPSQLQNSDLIADIELALNGSGLPAGRLEIELTEGAVLRNVDAARKLAQSMRDRGIGLSLDDFGTGYSALSHLTTLPFDTIKIDQSFVRRMDLTPEDGALLTAIIAMARDLGKTVLAEGIETTAQLEFLRAAGCHIGQGYFLGRPMEADAIPALIAARKAVSA